MLLPSRRLSSLLAYLSFRNIKLLENTRSTASMFVVAFRASFVLSSQSCDEGRTKSTTEISGVVGDSASDLCPLCHRRLHCRLVSLVPLVVHFMFWAVKKGLLTPSSFTVRACECSRAPAFRASRNKSGDPHDHCCFHWLQCICFISAIRNQCPEKWRDETG